MPSRPHRMAMACAIAIPTTVLAGSAESVPHTTAMVREQGRCAMRDSCGRKNPFGGEIPCPDNGLAVAHDDDLVHTSTLAQVCGDAFPTTTCCTLSQISILQSSLAQAEPLLASCPACRNNFRDFYCSFTCSPDQSLFVAVTATQNLTKDGKPSVAVKSVDFDVGLSFGQGFFDSCKSVKFGATNGYAMDLIGGGASDWLSFLRYMGQERALGSPFQISFPAPTSGKPVDNEDVSIPPAVPFDAEPLSCASADPSIRCACPDCPDVCATLPPVRSPQQRYEQRCRVGRMDCFPFALCIIYATALVAALGMYATREAGRRWGWSWTHRNKRGAIYLGAESAESDDGENLTHTRHSYGSFGRSGAGELVTRVRAWFGSVRRARPSNLVPGEEDATVLSDDEAAHRPILARSRSSENERGLVESRPIASELDGEGRPRSGTVDSGSSPSISRRSMHQSTTSSGAGALSLIASDPFVASPTAIQPRSYTLNTVLARGFYRLGLSCASRPWLVLATGLAACAVAHLGWGRFAVERDPVALWVPRRSQVARERARFDEAFGPFYRTEQIFFSALPGGPRTGDLGADGERDERQERVWAPSDEPVLSWETLEWLVDIEDDIRALRASEGDISLVDVCFAPTTSQEDGNAADVSECVVQSPLGYFANSLEDLSPATWDSSLDSCAATPASCLPPFGQPLNPKLVLSVAPGRAAHDARAVIVTYVLRNSLNPAETARAEAWEAALAGYLRALAGPRGPAAQRGIRVSWSVGTSLEEELNAATNTDVPIVVVSYLVMFLYVAVSLGGSGSGLLRAILRAAALALAAATRGAKWAVGKARGRGALKLGQPDEPAPIVARSRTVSVEPEVVNGTRALGAYVRRQILVESKLLLGLWAILIVLLSISTSVAICSAAGVKVTLVIAEVIPFLVLAIGVDNVFLLSHELEQQNTRSYRQGALLLPGDEDDDSDLYLAIEERVARTLSRVGPSILLSASCEVVAFALGTLVGMPAVTNFAVYAAGAVCINAVLQCTLLISLLALDLQRVEANRVDCFPCLKVPPLPSLEATPTIRESLLARFCRTTYAPNLVRKPVKFLVLALFSGLFVLSWIGARHIDLGLDQRLALPSSSYLVNYFNSVDSYLDVGPPVYFVVEGLNVTAISNVRHLCSRFSTCDDFSLANVLEAERKRSDSSYLAEPPAVWLDDFISWTNPILEDCCRVKRGNETEFCGSDVPEGACKPCFEDKQPPWSTTLEGYPQGGEFMRYLEHWLASPTDETCPLGGKAAYSTALDIRHDGESQDDVALSHFRTYHTPLKSQADFINALAAARRIANDLSRRTGAHVFPYSLFYVFFASYDEIWATAREVLAFALTAVFLVSALLLGSFRTGSVVAFTVFLSVVSVLGSMGAWGVSLNPLSLVNLVIAVGISVEFCAHLARAFMGAQGGGLPFNHAAGPRDRDERAVAALEDVGPSIVSGIGATKLIGIAVLGLTKSALLRTYYFKMWFALIVSSALHGLVLLPVLLTFFGGQGYALTTQDSDGGWIQTSVQRRYEREGRPFVDDDDDASSDGSDGF